MDDFFSRFVLSNQPAYRIGRHALFWVTWWIFLGFIYGFVYLDTDFDPLFAFSFAESLIFLPQHMILSYGIIYFLLPRFILKNRYWPGIGGILLLIVVAALMSPVMQKFFIIPLKEGLQLPVLIKRANLFHSFMGGLRGSMTIAGFAVAIKLVKHWYFKKVENEILEKEKLKAELQLLKGQLQPHFIFNTLNSIYSMSIKKSDQTSGAILKLSNLMRYMLTECNGLTIPLTKEIQIINNYIELGKSRMRERLELTINISGDFENKLIAPLLLLPFLENSFKYGAHEMLNNAWISLDMTIKGDVLKFKLINGRSSDDPAKNVSSQIGLLNVKKRLDLMYPNSHELRIIEDAETFIVQLTLQLDKIKIPESDEQVKLPAGR
jgi:sensor histidine kinase YesM